MVGQWVAVILYDLVTETMHCFTVMLAVCDFIALFYNSAKLSFVFDIYVTKPRGYVKYQYTLQLRTHKPLVKIWSSKLLSPTQQEKPLLCFFFVNAFNMKTYPKLFINFKLSPFNESGWIRGSARSNYLWLMKHISLGLFTCSWS